MLTLDDDLRFSFPEITAQVRILAERHIEDILPKFLRRVAPQSPVRPAVERIGRRRLTLIDLQRRKRAFDREPWTPMEVEAELRACVHRLAGLNNNSLDTLEIEFQRTLRIPDDGKVYPLPAGLSRFPLRSVDDFTAAMPDLWRKRGGVAMPMYQSEALWIRFSSRYPFAVKVGAGKINAVSGEPWSSGFPREPQGYVVTPGQPWLDGFCVGEGAIRQFVAMPLGAGYSVEEQVTGHAEFGGMQFQVYPMNAEFYFREIVMPSLPKSLRALEDFSDGRGADRRCRAPMRASVAESMGLGAGGKMRQEIYEDPHPGAAWDQTQTSRCFVHLCNSLIWRQITGENPPYPPLTAREYKQGGIPWFDHYRDDLKPVKGSKVLAKVKSVFQLGQEKKSQPLPENSSLTPELIVQYGNTRRPGAIREFFDTP